MSTFAMPTDAIPTDPEAAVAAAAAAAEQLALFQWAVREITTPIVVASFIACMLYGILLYMGASRSLSFTPPARG